MEIEFIQDIINKPLGTVSDAESVPKAGELVQIGKSSFSIASCEYKYMGAETLVLQKVVIKLTSIGST